MARNVYNTGTPDDDVNAQRDLIARVLAAQALGIPLEQYDAGQPQPYQDIADPSDPDAQAPGYTAAPSVSNVGFATNTSGHLADAMSNPEGTLGAVLGNPAAGMPSPGYNAPSMSDLASQAPTGNFGPAPTGSRTAADFASAFDAVAQGMPAGLPAGFFGPGFNTPGETISATPAPTATPSPAQPSAFDITGPMVAPALTLSDMHAPTPTPHSIVGDRFGEMQAPAVNVDTGYGTPADFTAADQAMSALNDAVASQMSDALAGYSVTGTPGPTAAPASTAAPAAPDVGVAVGYGVGLGLGDAVGGGFGGATGDGTSGGFGGDAGGPGVGGASTGISGGPGGTGEGGANTGEGGTDAGGAGAGGGGDGGK